MMSTPRLSPWLVGMVLSFVVAGCGASHGQRSAAAADGRCDPGGGFSAPDDSGNLVDVPDPSSRATVIELWARWCESCSAAVTQMLGRRNELAAEGIAVTLLGVLEQSESVDKARLVLASWGVREQFIIDRGGTIMRQYGIADLPAAVVLDKQGNVRWIGLQASASDTAAAARQAAGEPCAK